MIGNGSSGIQIVPAVLPRVAHLDHYIRGKAWLSPTFARKLVDEREGGVDNCESVTVDSRMARLTRLPVTFSEQEKAEFKADKKKYQAFRKGNGDH